MMAKPWSEVEQSPEYQSLVPDAQNAAKQQYFNSVVSVKPEFQVLKPEQQQAAQSQFLGTQIKAEPNPVGNLSTVGGPNSPANIEAQKQLKQAQGKVEGLDPQVAAVGSAYNATWPVSAIAKSAMGNGNVPVPEATTGGGKLLQDAGAVANPITGKAAELAFTGVGNAIKSIPGVKNAIANMLLNPEFKQTGADWDYNHDARRVMATMPDIVGHDFDSTAKAIANKTKETGQAIGDTIANSPASSSPIGLSEKDVIGHIDDAIAELNKADPSGNAPTINKLMQKRIALTNQFDKDGNIVAPHDFENMTPQEAFDFKLQKLGNVKYTGNDGTDLTAVNSALQKSRANIVAKMNQALPELGPLNQDYGDLKAAAEGVDKAALKAQNQSLSSIKWHDVLSLGLNKWLFNPQNRVQMAQFLYSAPKADVEAISKIVPDFQSTINKVYALPSPQSVGQSIRPIEESGIAKRPEAMINNSNPNANRFMPIDKTVSQRAQSLSFAKGDASQINVGPYQNVSPNAMKDLINAHQEVSSGNIDQDSVQHAIDMGNYARSIDLKGANIKVFSDFASAKKYALANQEKIEAILPGDNDSFIAKLKGK